MAVPIPSSLNREHSVVDDGTGGTSPPEARWYGDATSPYHPLGTSLPPRLPNRNDLIPLQSDRVAVVLQDGDAAVMSRVDYEQLRSKGWKGRLTHRKVTGDNLYPSINHGPRIYTVARVILAAGPRERIRYANGNHLDLTRANLVLSTKGGARVDASGRTAIAAPAITAEQRRTVSRRMGTRSRDGQAAQQATAAALERHAAKNVAKRGPLSPSSPRSKLASSPFRFASEHVSGNGQSDSAGKA